MRIGEDWRVAYEYDYLGRVAAIVTPAGTTRTSYDTAAGRITQQLPNGASTIREFNSDGSLASVLDVSRDNVVLRRLHYRYRPDGLLASVREQRASSERETTYTYDIVQRLSSVMDSQDGRIDYAYDPYGNRTAYRRGAVQHAHTHDWLGRLLTSDGVTVTHDASGNVEAGAGGGYKYEYDDLQRLVRIKRSETGDSIKYRYDAEGRLSERLAGGRISRFFFDPYAESWQPLVVVDNDRATYFVWQNDTLVATVTDGKATYYVHDHLASVRGSFAGDTGLRSIDYDPFGSPRDAVGGEPVAVASLAV